MSLLSNILGQAAPDDSSCTVNTCEASDGIEVTELHPLDPIDHEVTLVPLCSDHQEWAKRRNEFAREVAAELREKRAEIGNREIETVRAVRDPPDGEVDDGMSLSVVSEAREMATEMMGADSHE